MARLLRRLAAKLLGPEKAAFVWGRVDVVGDIALIKSPSIAGREDPLSLREYELLAEALVEELPYIRSVWLLRSPTRGDSLVREVVFLAGEKRSTTIYKEHGCEFEVDIRKVFVSPRLNFEHIRVARDVTDGEVVVNMFAGAGLFSILIACLRRTLVYSIDKSRYAYEYMVRNVERNSSRLLGRVVPLHGDAARIIENKLQGVSDRVLEPYPRLALAYLPYALMALRGHGLLHVYLHVEFGRGEDPISKAATYVCETVRGLGAACRIRGARRVRPVGPRLWQVVVDVEAEKRAG